MPEKSYLGDGVYCQIDHGRIILTTENGIEVQNSIVLEPEVCIRLAKEIEKFMGAK